MAEYIEPEKFFLHIYDDAVITLDLETTGLDFMKDRILLWAFKYKDTKTVVNHKDFEKYRKVLHYILNKEDTLILGHNIKFDYKFIKKVIPDINCKFGCTYINQQIIMSGLDASFSLASLVDKYCQEVMDKRIRKNFIGRTNDLFTQDELDYALGDVEYIETIYNLQLDILKGYNLLNVQELESNCIPVYGDIEFTGFRVNRQYWQTEIIDYYTKELKFVKSLLDSIIVAYGESKYLNKFKSIDLFSGEEVFLEIGSRRSVKTGSPTTINWSSSQQITDVYKTLYKMKLLNYEEVETTGYDTIITYSGEFNKLSTASIEDQLEYLKMLSISSSDKSSEHLSAALYVYKKINKLLTSFGVNYLDKFVSEEDDRIHPEFHQIGTDTGRVSCSNPNMQQIPSINQFRGAFQAIPGWKLLTLDYSGAELRIIAEGSQDQTMITAFLNGEDLHSKMATVLWGIPVSKTENKDKRDQQKTVNFGLAYGAGPNKFKHLFSNDMDKAKQFIKKYFSTFPNIGKFLENLGTHSKTKNYSMTMSPYNRIRWYSYDTTNFKETSEVERAGKNQPIQGTCADIVKLATYRVHKFLKENYKDNAFIVNQVHDEIVIEFNAQLIEEEQFAKQIHNIMLEAGKTVIKSIPMEVDYNISTQWKK